MQNKNRFLKVTATIAIAAQIVSAATDITAKFTDPNFRTEVYKAIGRSSGIIYDSDVSGIIDFNVNYKDIKSLSGIEYFTGLKILHCAYNQLTELDVSKNTELLSFYCEVNQLTELDVSNNTKLIHFYCHYNQLTELDVSKNTKLLELGVPNNQLTTLDVSNNTELWFLHIAENRITAIDLSKNTKLEEFYSSDNQLTELNLLNNKALTKVFVERNLFASENDIKGLNTTKYTVYNFEPQRRKNTITFDTGENGSAVAPLIDILSFEKITEPAAPTKEYHSFRGWFTDEACTKQWNFESNTVEQDITLYADWYDTHLGDAIRKFVNRHYIYNGEPQILDSIEFYNSESDKWITLYEYTDFNVEYDVNTDYTNSRDEAVSVIVIGKGERGQRVGVKNIEFTINKLNIEVSGWDSTSFIYNGKEQLPTPVIAEEYRKFVTVKSDFESINVGRNYAELVLASPNNNINISSINNRTSYTINPKYISVIWGEEREFVYNKMVQHPTFRLEPDEIPMNNLRIINAQSQVGVYKDSLAPFIMIKPESDDGNYKLVNSSVDYKIVKKPLNVALKKDGGFADEVSVNKKAGITASDILDSLRKIIGYDGFATDTTTNETDNETNSFTSGEPGFEITLRESGQSSRSLRDGGAIAVNELLQNGEYNVAVKVSDIIAQ
ncbi:MAG: InlB B-repeat-containing protein, partial [Chitinispirillales bacterium]|nr:InlB B-repeat-containing protein [Chitinispirillales bacterium]